MKLSQVLLLAITSTLATFANGYFFDDTSVTTETKKESTGLKVNEKSHIYGGKEVDIDDFPYTVNLRIAPFDVSACTGALITPRWVLTAAHCVRNDEFDMIAVLGSNEINGSAGEHIPIVEGYRHPGYVRKKHLYDIGLLKLAEPSKHEVAKMCAEDGSDNEVGTIATTVGWGKTENRVPSDKLLGVNVEIITNARCNKRYKNKKYKNRITEGMLCAGTGDGKDSCNGDSGGPLVVKDTLVGIASWGRKCGARPGVYTRLTYVMDYIKDIVNGGDGSKFENASSGQEVETPKSSSDSTEWPTSASSTGSSAMDSSSASTDASTSASASASGSWDFDFGSESTSSDASMWESSSSDSASSSGYDDDDFTQWLVSKIVSKRGKRDSDSYPILP